jgi:large subunit ribosomal protein L13
MRKTVYTSKEAALKERNWKIVDAAGVPVGRLATQIASALRGKEKVSYTPHVDNGDFVVVINANKIVLTGTKPETKKYYRYSGFIGGLKEIKAGALIAEKPTEVVRLAVWGMLPKGPLGRRLITKLKIYNGPNHPHKAQHPTATAVRESVKSAARSATSKKGAAKKAAK